MWQEVTKSGWRICCQSGQTWLTSLSWNGCTLTSSTAAFSYVSGSAIWTWGTDRCDFGTIGSTTSVSVVHAIGTGVSGWITPKYQVVGLTYTPPGAKSTATYSNGFQSGTSTGNTSSFKTGVTVTDEVNSGFSLFGILNGSQTTTYSAGWEQMTSSSNTITLSQQYSTGLIVPGPASSSVGWIIITTQFMYGSTRSSASPFIPPARSPSLVISGTRATPLPAWT